MARPDTLIDELRSRLADLDRSFTNLGSVQRRYVALGGAEFLAPYFLDAEGNPRTDLDITADDIPNAFATLAAIEALLQQGHLTNLAKLIR